VNYDGFQALRVSLDQGLATVTIKHGEINLFDRTLIGEMDRLGRVLEGDDEVRAVVLQSGNPQFFIAHADVTLIQMLPTDVAPRAEKLGMFHAMCDRFRTMPKATIAKIEGMCRGGGSEFALACDMRFAAIGRAVLSQPEVAVGIIPGGGGCVRLPRLVGRSRALEIILGCGDIDAVTAERYGYVNRALPENEIGPFVDRLARRIASFPAKAIRLAKEAVLAADRHVEDDLVQEERNFFASLSDSETKRRMTAAMTRGLQTSAIEVGEIDDFLLALAH
jgi:enoyl-CoA hydratase/carnithine racemase